MALPSRGQVYGLFLQVLDDPAATVYTDVPNATTGALSVFQAGFSQAFDLLFSNALNQQVPTVELVVEGIIIPPSPIPFSVSTTALGLPNFADFEWIAERTAGSNDKFIDILQRDRLTQRAPTDRLFETVYENNSFNFCGCTTVRELQIKYVESASAPTSNAAVIGFDGSLNFLANYSAACAGPGKGDDDIATRCRSFSVGPKFDQGSIGGELFRLMQPLVRERQHVQIAPRPFSSQRRIGVRRGIWWVAAQAGTTGGGSQNVPMQFSSANGTIIGSIDGVNLVFWLSLGVQGFSLYRNGRLQTLNMDYVATNNQLTFLSASVPQPGDTLTAEGYPIYQV